MQITLQTLPQEIVQPGGGLTTLTLSRGVDSRFGRPHKWRGAAGPFDAYPSRSAGAQANEDVAVSAFREGQGSVGATQVMEEHMRKMIVGSMVVGALMLVAGQAQAADTMIDGLKKACNKELTTFCKGVNPGEGRVLACLYAFEDKVSDKCAYAVYDAADQLEKAVAALKFATTQCKDDLLKYCGDVEAGQGRGLACLKKNDKSVSQSCKDALKATGLKK